MKTIKKIEWRRVDDFIWRGSTPEPFGTQWSVYLNSNGGYEVFGPCNWVINGVGGIDEAKTAAESRWRAMVLEDADPTSLETRLASALEEVLEYAEEHVGEYKSRHAGGYPTYERRIADMEATIARAKAVRRQAWRDLDA